MKSYQLRLFYTKEKQALKVYSHQKTLPSLCLPIM